MPAAATSTRNVGDITCMIDRLRNHFAIGRSRRNRRGPGQACAGCHQDRDHQVTHIRILHICTETLPSNRRVVKHARVSIHRCHAEPRAAQISRSDERRQRVEIADQCPAIDFVRDFAAEQAVTACHFQVAPDALDRI